MSDPTPAYDFAAAEVAFNSTREKKSGEFYDTMIFALRLAAKVMQTPSHAMQDAFYENATVTSVGTIPNMAQAFTAMISQACAEVENETVHKG